MKINDQLLKIFFEVWIFCRNVDHGLGGGAAGEGRSGRGEAGGVVGGAEEEEVKGKGRGGCGVGAG